MGDPNKLKPKPVGYEGFKIEIDQLEANMEKGIYDDKQMPDVLERIEFLKNEINKEDEIRKTRLENKPDKK